MTTGSSKDRVMRIGVHLGTDAEWHREVRARVADVDVAQDRDVTLAHDFEDDVAERVGSGRRRFHLERPADDHARDPVQHPRLSQHVQVVPDHRGRGEGFLPEQDRPVEALGAQRGCGRLHTHQSVEHPADQRAFRAARPPRLPPMPRRERTDRRVVRQDPDVEVRELVAARVVDLVPLAESERDEIGVQRDQPGPGMERQMQGGDVAHPEHRFRIAPAPPRRRSDPDSSRSSGRR